MFRRFVASMVVSCLAFAFPSRASVASPPVDGYTITDLGMVVGGTWSNAWGINNAGQVVGTSTLAGGYGRAYLWTDGAMKDLGSLGGSGGGAYGVNDLGQVAGVAGTSQYSHAFLWSDGVMTDLGALPGGQSSRAWDINVSGQVVGDSTATGGYNRPFLWSDGVMINLGTLESNKHSYAKGINSLGQVVGSSGSHAFLWTEGTMINLDPSSGKRSEANAINDSGQIVGASMAWGNGRACLWDDGVMTNLGVLPDYDVSDAMDINFGGDVVGWSHTSSGDECACLWSDGATIDLNGVIEGDSEWWLQRAMGINDSGQIVGYGLLNGSPRAFILTPVPEPSALVLLGIGVVGFLARTRHFVARV